MGSLDAAAATIPPSANPAGRTGGRHGARQLGPLPLDRMCIDVSDAPMGVPLHPAAERFWCAAISGKSLRGQGPKTHYITLR